MIRPEDTQEIRRIGNQLVDSYDFGDNEGAYGEAMSNVNGLNVDTLSFLWPHSANDDTMDDDYDDLSEEEVADIIRQAIGLD